MSEQTQAPLQKRENFKKKMIAQGKLPQVGEAKNQVNTQNNFSVFESWTHYTNRK